MAVSQLNDPLEFVVKEEKIDETMDCNTLVGAPIKFEDFSDNQETDTKELLTIKSEIIDENLQGEIILELMNNEGEMKGEIIDFSDAEFEEEKPQTSTKSKKDTNDWFLGIKYSPIFNSPNKSWYLKLGLISDDCSRPSSFLCDFCGFQHRYCNRFYKHYIKHFDISSVKHFKCHICEFKTIYKTWLNSHIQNLHSTEKQYLCDKCDFRTNYFYGLKRHQITHSEYKHVKISSHKCDICSYETKTKFFLDQHRKVHFDVSELEMFKCKLCPYESKRKMNVYNHMKVHKKISDTRSYDCELCEYKSKYSHLLRGHIKTNHKIFPKSLIRKCEKCPFETNNKYSLETHMKNEHKEPKQQKLFKCDQCKYVTHDKQRLIHRHAMIHKNIMERTIYECYNCGLKLKYKNNLRRHIILNHLLKQTV